MRGTESEADLADIERPVLPWRLVVGVALHVVLPAYVVVLAGGWLIAGPATVSGEALLTFAAGASWRFCFGYAALTLAAAVAARLLDPVLRRRRQRRDVDDPVTAAFASAHRVARATTQAERFGAAASAAAAKVRTARWDHGDNQCQAIARDLVRAIDAFAVAYASAAIARRAQVAGLAANALEGVAAAVEELADGRARLDEGDAVTHARYLAQRYASGALDRAGPGND